MKKNLKLLMIALIVLAIEKLSEFITALIRGSHPNHAPAMVSHILVQRVLSDVDRACLCLSFIIFKYYNYAPCKYIKIFYVCLFREVETASAMDQSGIKPTVLSSSSSAVGSWFYLWMFFVTSLPLINPLIPKEIEKENSVIVINVKPRETQIQIRNITSSSASASFLK